MILNVRKNASASSMNRTTPLLLRRAQSNRLWSSVTASLPKGPTSPPARADLTEPVLQERATSYAQGASAVQSRSTQAPTIEYALRSAVALDLFAHRVAAPLPPPLALPVKQPLAGALEHHLHHHGVGRKAYHEVEPFSRRDSERAWTTVSTFGCCIF